jgi:C1q domain
MKLKIVVVDFEIPMKVKKWAVRAGIPAVILTVAAVAYADTLHTWATGDTLNASDLNGNFANLQSQITTPTFATRTPSGFHAYLSQATSVSTTGLTIVFDHVDYDLASEYTAGTGTFTAQSAGIYVATCNLYYTPNGTPQVYELGIQKNGGSVISGATQSSTAAGDAGSIIVQAAGAVQLAKGDLVTCATNQYSGTAQSLDVSSSYRNTFSVTRIY